MPDDFKRQLERKMDEFAHFVYEITRTFPKEELYGIVSHLRRAAVSIILNYKEGYARRKLAVQLNFLEISYGSLKEGWITAEVYQKGLKMAEDIGKMLWSEIDNIDNKNQVHQVF